MTKPITIVLDADTGKAQVKIGQAANKVSGDLGKMSKAVQDTDAAVLKADASLNKAIGTLTKFAAVGAAAVTAAFAASAKVGMDFEKAVVEVGNSSNLSAEGLEKFTNRARELSRETGKASEEILRGERAFLQIGLSVDQAGESIEHATKLATAMGGEVASAVDGIGVAFDLFGKKAEDSADITDKLTVALQNSQFSGLDPLVQGLKTAAKETAALGMSFEATLQGVTLFDKVGFGASNLGMAMRTLASGTGNVQKGLESLGLTFEEINPETVDFTDIVRRLAETSIGAQEAVELFGSRAGLAMLAVIDKVKNFPTILDDMDQAFADSAGATEKAFQTMMETASGMLSQISASIKDALVSIYNTYKDQFARIVSVVSDRIGELGEYLSSAEFREKITGIFESIAKAATTTYRVLSSTAGIVVDAFKWAYDNRLVLGIVAIEAAVVALNIKLMALKIHLAATGGLIAALRTQAALLHNAVMFAGGWPMVIGAAAVAYKAMAIAANEAKAAIQGANDAIKVMNAENDRLRGMADIIANKYGGIGTVAYQAWEQSRAALEDSRVALENLGLDVDDIADKVFAAGGSFTMLGAELEKALEGKNYQVVIEAGKISLTKMSMDIEKAIEDGVKNWPEKVREQAAGIAQAVGGAIFQATETGSYEEFMDRVNNTLWGAVKTAVEKAFIDAVISKQVIEPLVALMSEIDISTTDGLSKWMAEARDAVGQASRQFEALWPVVKMVQEEFSFLAPEVEQATDALSGAADYAGTQIDDLGTRSSVLAEDFGGLGSAAMDAASGLRAAAQEASQGVGGTPKGGGFSGKWDPVRQSWQTESGSVKADEWGQLWYYPGKQYATGTEHVAKTGPAIVHEGEKIIRKQESSRSGGSMTLQFNITALDPVGMKKVVRDSIMPELQRAAARGWA